MRRTTPVTAVLFIALTVSAGLAEAQERLRHPRLHAALFELREAKLELLASKHDFGGHKKKALLAVDDAITSVKALLRLKDDTVRGVDRKPDFYKKYKDFPRLRQALADLREARDELREARGDDAGLRKRALRDINFAIDQIQLLLKNARV